MPVAVDEQHLGVIMRCDLGTSWRGTGSPKHSSKSANVCSTHSPESAAVKDQHFSGWELRCRHIRFAHDRVERCPNASALEGTIAVTILTEVLGRFMRRTIELMDAREDAMQTLCKTGNTAHRRWRPWEHSRRWGKRSEASCKNRKMASAVRVITKLQLSFKGQMLPVCWRSAYMRRHVT